MKQIHILYSEIKEEIKRDFTISSFVKKKHNEAKIDTLFIPESADYSLLNKYCKENEIAPIEIFHIEDIDSDIDLSYFSIIQSYSERNRSKNNLFFIPKFPSNKSERLENFLRELDFEVETTSLS